MKILPLALVVLFAVSVGAGAQTVTAKKVLVFTKSSGYEHSVIHRVGTNLSTAELTLQGLGASNNIEFTFTKDGGWFTPEKIAGFDAFLFYTTGDLTETGTDKNPPMSVAGKAAFLEAIRNGKGFVGVHSATDTFHSPGNKELGPPRFQEDGTNADPYIQMIGAEFVLHGSQQKAQVISADSSFPGLTALPPNFGPLEEWYTLKNFSSNLHVLLIQDTSTMQKNNGNYCYDRPPYPSTWAHLYGKGRVFYTSMGHREDVWSNPVYQQILLGGINWAVRNVDADVTPNLEKATPDAGFLPAYRKNP